MSLKMASKPKRAKVRSVIDAGDRMQLVGGMMSNICFNGKQRSDIPENFRKSMEDAQRLWDEAAAVWHGVTKQLKSAARSRGGKG